MLEEVKRVQAQARCLFDNAQVEAILDRMAEEITARFGNSNPILLCVMNGGLVVTGRLLPKLPFPLQVDYLHATRYRGRLQGDDLQWKAHPSLPLEGRTVLILDDILDEGNTLVGIRDYCIAQRCSEVASVVLVDKQHDRRHPAITRADITGCETPDLYLFGCGLDYKDYLRNAPGIFAVAD